MRSKNKLNVSLILGVIAWMPCGWMYRRKEPQLRNLCLLSQSVHRAFYTLFLYLYISTPTENQLCKNFFPLFSFFFFSQKYTTREATITAKEKMSNEGASMETNLLHPRQGKCIYTQDRHMCAHVHNIQTHMCTYTPLIIGRYTQYSIYYIDRYAHVCSYWQKCVHIFNSF